MEQERLIQLTNAIYSLTVLFPKKEPLRYKMRELADCILARPQKEDLEILQSFFEVAKEQRWVREEDLLPFCHDNRNRPGIFTGICFFLLSLSCLYCFT